MALALGQAHFAIRRASWQPAFGSLVFANGIKGSSQVN